VQHPVQSSFPSGGIGRPLSPPGCGVVIGPENNELQAAEMERHLKSSEHPYIALT
jgi:hypothetical protein